MFESSLKKKLAPTVKKKFSNKTAFFLFFDQFSGSGRVAKRPGRSLHAWGTFLEPRDQSKKKSKNRDFEKSIKHIICVELWIRRWHCENPRKRLYRFMWSNLEKSIVWSGHL